MADAPSTSTVAVITYCRPEHVRICLEHLAVQTRRPDQVLVVDSSPDGRTRALVGAPGGPAAALAVTYLRNEAGSGSMATSRAIALAATTSEVLAFVDDDAYADPDWLEHLLAPYADPLVVAVGGRQRRGQPDEERPTGEPIGALLPDGRLTGGFTQDTGADLPVDHLLGANMSVRVGPLRELGGIRDYYPGTCLREESDIYLRLRRAGGRVVYTPAAVVTHVAAPYARGQRFDLRYDYYAQRNHVVLLARTFGGRDRLLRGYVASVLRQDVGGGLLRALRTLGTGESAPARVRARRAAGPVVRATVSVAGLVAGGVAAARLRRRDGAVPTPTVSDPSARPERWAGPR